MSSCLRIALVCLLLPAAGCAARQTRLHAMDPQDRLLLVRCLEQVLPHLCPEDPNCQEQAIQAYAAEPPAERRQWLLDYGCPRELVPRAGAPTGGSPGT